MGTWILASDWTVRQNCSRDQRVVKTKMVSSHSKENQAKLWGLGPALEFTANTGLKTRSSTCEAISKIRTSVLMWRLIIDDSNSLCVPETLTNCSMLRGEEWEGTMSRANNGRNWECSTWRCLKENAGIFKNPKALGSNQPGASIYARLFATPKVLWPHALSVHALLQASHIESMDFV